MQGEGFWLGPSRSGGLRVAGIAESRSQRAERGRSDCAKRWPRGGQGRAASLVRAWELVAGRRAGTGNDRNLIPRTTL